MEKRSSIWLSKKVLPALLIFFAGMQILVAFSTYQQTLTFDEAMWQYIGRNWFANGLTPYSGGVDNKSPLIFAIFGFSDKLFGTNFWFPRLLGIAFQTLGLFFVYKIAKRFSGRQAGILALSIYGLSLLWHDTGGKYVSYTESYSVAFVVGAFYLVICREKNNFLLISGILSGLAIAFRATGVMASLAIFIFLVINNGKKSFIFLSGVLGMIVLLLTIFHIAGINLNDLFAFQFSDNFSAGGIASHPIGWRLRNLLDNFFKSGLVFFIPPVIGYIFSTKINIGLTLWLLFEFIGLSIIGLYANQHFKNLLPVLSLMTTFGLIHFMKRHKIAYKALLLVVWVFFFPKSLEPFIRLSKILFPAVKNDQTFRENANIQPDDNTKKILGMWVRSCTNREDKVFIAGYSSIIQAYSERVSPSIYFNVTQTAIAKQRLFEDLTRVKPKMILLPGFPEYDSLVNPDIRNFISAVVAQNYYLERKIYGYNVYRKKLDVE